MDRVVLLIGRLAAVGGMVLVVVASGARIAGYFWLGGFQAGTLLLAAMALLLIGCLGHLHVLVVRGGGS
jgi:hypothetical protein